MKSISQTQRQLCAVVSQLGNRLRLAEKNAQCSAQPWAPRGHGRHHLPFDGHGNRSPEGSALEQGTRFHSPRTPNARHTRTPARSLQVARGAVGVVQNVNHEVRWSIANRHRRLIDFPFRYQEDLNKYLYLVDLQVN